MHPKAGLPFLDKHYCGYLITVLYVLSQKLLHKNESQLSDLYILVNKYALNHFPCTEVAFV